MTNLIVVQPFLHFARASSPPSVPPPVSLPTPDGWARVVAWAEEVLSAGSGKESLGQALFFSVHFALFLALLVVATGLFMVAKLASQDDRQEKREIVPEQEGTVEKELSRDEADTTTDTTDSSSTGSLSGSGSGTSEITQDSHERFNEEGCKGVERVRTGKPELGAEIPDTIPILLASSSVSDGSGSGNSCLDTSESFEDCVAQHAPISFDAPDRVLCEQVLRKIAELNDRLEVLSQRSKMNGCHEMPPVSLDLSITDVYC